MKHQIPGLAALILALAALPAGAQTTTSGVRQQRALSPAQRAQAPASAAAPATVIRPEATAVQAAPYVAAVAGKQTIPANLFSVEDRAIIIVGGKPVAAGDVKRQLVNELRQQSVPATVTYRRINAANVPAGTPIRENPGGGMGNGRQSRDRIEANTRIPSAGAYTNSRDSIKAGPALSYTETLNYCKTHPAEISHVSGTVTPTGRFKIQGICFGNQTGLVEAIGQFPGGMMGMVFDRWTENEIIAFVPPVSGAPDHTIALTVVRPDKSRSAALQARFVATRQQVMVPARLWSPNPDFIRIEVDQGGGDIFTGFKVWGAGSASRATPFSVSVNPYCNLDGASMTTRTGRVDAFNGWENGPPNQADVEIVWTPQCTTHTSNYILASSSQRVCSIDFTVTAVASCPIGLAP